MSAVIRVDNLAKQYAIGTRQDAYETLRDSVARGFRNLLNARPRTESVVTRFWALENVNFEVRAGEVVGVIGRNGAGKSTLLRVLSRITAPTRGRVALRGRVGSLLEVGTGFHPELTGRENTFLNGAILGMSRREIARRFDEIIAFAEIDDFVDTPVKRYSSGMYLRLAFAVAAHFDPDILLIDEVLAVGDAQFQKKCIGKIEEVAGVGRTVLFVSHNVPAIQRLCQRGIVLSRGHVVCDADVNTAVAEYLGHGDAISGERLWGPTEAPRDGVIRLRAVRSTSPDGVIMSRFSVREAWQLEVAFDVLTPGHLINLNVYCYDAAGNLLFVTGDFQSDEWQDRPRPVGRHQSRCSIPGDLLNEGELRVLVALVSPPNALRVLERDALAVEVYDDLSTSGARGFYPAPWPGGAVRPLLKWDFDFEGTAD